MTKTSPLSLHRPAGDGVRSPPPVRRGQPIALAITRRAPLYWLCAVAVCAVVTLAAFETAERRGVNELRRVNTMRVEYFARSLETSLERHESLPFIVARQRDVIDYLREPRPGAQRDALNRYLRDLRAQARVAVIYLMDATGETVAASNFDQPITFLGHNYAFRPYFNEAMAGRPGRFYAVGVTTQEPGYFLSYPVRDDNRVVGVATVKIALDDDESSWVRSGEKLALVDANGVVFLSSEPHWKYRPLRPLGRDVRATLRATRQYYALQDRPLLPPGASVDAERASRVRLTPEADDCLVQARAVGPIGWQVLLFTDLGPVEHDARLAAAASGFCTLLVWLLGFAWAERERRRHDRAAADAELSRLSASLEQSIAERTAALLEANAALARKVGELEEAERILRDARDESIQAGKLAVLGQMAAGMTHELNQPLAALRTLSDNAITLLERNREGEARDNLALIAELADRMGNIVAQLKSFARKRPLMAQPVCLRRVVERSWQLASTRYRDASVSFAVIAPPDAVVALGDPVRLEQVLVNLLCNAIDAVGGQSPREVEVVLEQAEGRVRVHVHDTGPGLSAEALEHLFEPFFTTKPVGEGLGLGLSISRAIVEVGGGTLRARNRPRGGAEFTIDIEAAPCQETPSI